MNNTCNGNGQYGIHVYDRCDGTILINNTASYNKQHGICLEELVDNCTLVANTANNNTVHGIMLYNNCYDNNITSNYVIKNGWAGICVRLQSGSNNLSHNIAENNTLYGIWMYDNCDFNVIINNTLRYNDQQGIQFSLWCDYNNVTENDIILNGQNGIEFRSSTNHNNKIWENNIWQNGGSGLFFIDDAMNNSIWSNYIFNNTLCGVNISISTCLNMYFYRNLIWWNVNGSIVIQILDSGTNTALIENLLDAMGDFDNDLLTNIYEYENGLDPWNADTDGDGYTDGEEVSAGSDPLDPNSIPADFWRDYGLILIIIIGAVAGAVVVVGVTRSRKDKPKKAKPKPPKAAPKAEPEVASAKVEAVPAKVEPAAPQKPPVVIEETVSTKKTTKIMKRGLKLFFSYSSRDSIRYHIAEIARKLTELPDIEEALYWEKDATASIIEYMDANVGKCDIFLMFCSEETIKSSAVKIEWQAALSIGKDMVPIYDKLEHIPTLLRTFRGVKFREDDVEGTINDLHELIIKKLTLQK